MISRGSKIITGSHPGGIVARPGLFARIEEPARVTVLSAPAGSGKTVLLRSWTARAQIAGHVAWVTAGRDGRDTQRFWVSVLGALRRTGPGSALVQALTAAPDADGWAIVERLLTDLAALRERLWLVVDDLHELSPDARRQLELLILRAPPRLRFVLAARHDMRLGLHRLRLEGSLAEIRPADLRFSLAEARELFTAAGVELPESALTTLHERTEGWAAGLRLAALSLDGHPDPERFAAEFSGIERTIAEYLMAEVLDRRPEPVRRLLLRTSILERVNGELADVLTGDPGGEGVLQDLEQTGAFTVSLDPGRSWFRYHQLFADLLRLELRRTAPGEVTALHRTAACWLADHGFGAEAVRHAQDARDWELATRVLADHWTGLYLDGESATIHELLAGFPAGASIADPRLAALTAGDELARGSLDAAQRCLDLAEEGPAPEDRRPVQLLVGINRLMLARQRGNLEVVRGEGRRLQAMAQAPGMAAPGAQPPGLGQDLRALALISLGVAELWSGQFTDGEHFLGRGVALARQAGRPYLEFTGLAHLAVCARYVSFTRAAACGRQAITLAERHGWTDDSAAGVACAVVGGALTWQGQPAESEPWVQRAERTLRAGAEPAVALGVRYVRGLLDLVRGRNAEALSALRPAAPLAGGVTGPDYLVLRMRALLVHALVRLGDITGARKALAGFGSPGQHPAQEPVPGEVHVSAAILHLATGDPRAATAALASVTSGTAPLVWPSWQVQAFLLDAIARDAMGDESAADDAVERALGLAEADGALAPFLLHPVPRLLERHARHRASHAALVASVQGTATGTDHGPRAATRAGAPEPLSEPLSDSELRVLRYLPTNLTAPEIASELSVSRNTVKTHMRNVYAKLGTHRRAETVARARDLGLLAPSALRR